MGVGLIKTLSVCKMIDTLRGWESRGLSAFCPGFDVIPACVLLSK